MVVLSLALGVAACTSNEQFSLPPRATVTVLPAADAPPEPAAAGPVTTTTTVPITTTSMPGSVTYAVQAGDTFYGIASKTNTPYELLLALNPLKDPANLMVGQLLIVPGPATPTTGVAGAPGDTVPGAVPGGAEGTAPGETTTTGTEVTVSTLPAATKTG